jgi:hypothetical protein
MKLALPLLAALALGCGADPTPAPTDAAVDAPADASDGAPVDPCVTLNRLDCDGDPSRCETPISDQNCGACGRRCPAGALCSIATGRCLQ